MPRQKLIEECETLSQKGLLEAATSCYHDYLAVNPHDAEAFRGLANICQRKGEDDRAASLLRHADSLDNQGKQTPDSTLVEPRRHDREDHSECTELNDDISDEVDFFEDVEREETGLRVNYDAFQEDCSQPSDSKGRFHLPVRCQTNFDECSSPGDTADLEYASAATQGNDDIEDAGQMPRDSGQSSTEYDEEVLTDGSCEESISENGENYLNYERGYDTDFEKEFDDSFFDYIVDIDTGDREEDLNEETESEEFGWLDLISLEFTEEEIHESQPQSVTELYGINTDGQRLDEWEKAKLMAYEVADEIGDTSSRLVSVLNRIFRLSPYPATRKSLVREIQRGATPDDLEAAVEVRTIWQNHPEFANSFRYGRDDKGEGWRKTEQARRMLSWPAALAVVQAFWSYPCHEEIERIIEEIFEDWWESEARRRRFPEFRLYLGCRTGAIPGYLKEWPEWTFNCDPALADPFLKEDDPDQRLLWRKTKRELGLPEFLGARPPVSSRPKRPRNEEE